MLAKEFSLDLILIEYQAPGRSLVQDFYRPTSLSIKADLGNFITALEFASVIKGPNLKELVLK